MAEKSFNSERRQAICYGFLGVGTLISSTLLAPSIKASILIKPTDIKLSLPDSNGIRLPHGFTSRAVAYSGHNLFGYQWHAAPDGGSVFPTPDQGWIYVSNSEMNHNAGGVGAIRFDSKGKLLNAYPILKNTSMNCAGGHTPWKTWLSCEETDFGQVWECDPYGQKMSISRAKLGIFKHEAVAVDTKNHQLYLTEDQPDGCLYRYTSYSTNSAGYPDLDNGYLEVAEIVNNRKIGKVQWHILPDPQAKSLPTRRQVKQSSKFNGGEGIWYHQEVVYFTTKGDDRVWAYETETQNLSLIYNAAFYLSPVLTGVDNITANTAGTIFVAEDGGNMQVVVITKSGLTYPLLQVTGHNDSEITGPAFSPDESRLYFSSQRGKTGKSEDGITFEVTGPFNKLPHL